MAGCFLAAAGPLRTTRRPGTTLLRPTAGPAAAAPAQVGRRLWRPCAARPRPNPSPRPVLPCPPPPAALAGPSPAGFLCAAIVLLVAAVAAAQFVALPLLCQRAEWGAGKYPQFLVVSEWDA